MKNNVLQNFYRPGQFLPGITILICVLATTTVSAQDSPMDDPIGWKNRIAGDASFTQNQFDNWTSGGENAWTWQMNLDGNFYNTTPRYRWNNSISFSFGQTQVGDLEARKSADEIKLETVATLRRGLDINPYISATGLTQFARGFEYIDDTTKIAISAFFDPAYFTQSIGMGWFPNNITTVRLGASTKETITRNHSSPYADDPETSTIEKIKIEYGAEMVAELINKFGDKFLYESKLEMFSNFKSSREIDVNWDNTLTAVVTKYVHTTLKFRLFYDHDISPRRQIKQTLSLGLSYVFL